MLRSLFAGLWARTSTLTPLPDGWDFETTAESFPAITTSATFSFARRFYRAAYRDLARSRGLPERRLTAYEEVFDGILGYREGWIGIRPGAWARYEELLATLPPIRFDLAARVGAHLARQGRELGGHRKGLAELDAAKLAARYRAFEAAAFRDAGLAVATDMRVLAAYSEAAAALARAGIDPQGADGARMLAQGGSALAAAWRGPGEMLLEREPPTGGPERAALMAALSRQGQEPPEVPEAARPAVAGAKAWIAWRERMRAGRAAIFDGARAILGEIGRKSGLDADVWFLEVDELLVMIDAPGGAGVSPASWGDAKWQRARRPRPRDPRLLVGERRAAFQRWREMPAGQSNDADLLAGIIAWPGSVTGTARVVADPAEAPDLQGDILVAERTDPGWTPLFASAGAILVQHGNPLCHAAILARELGVPAIVGIRGLMAAVRDGDRLAVDAGAGSVRILR